MESPFGTLAWAGTCGRLTLIPEISATLQLRQCCHNFALLFFYQGDEFLWGARILLNFAIRVDCFQIKPFVLQGLTLHCPAAVAVSSFGQKSEELLEAVKGEWGALAHLDIRQIILPYALRPTALLEEQDVRLCACTRRRENTLGKTDDAIQVAVVQQLSFGLHKGVFIGAEQNALIKDDAALAAALQAVDDVLQEQHLCRAGLVGKVRLRFLAFFASKGGIGEDHIILPRRVDEQAAEHLVAREGVTVPDGGLVNAVENQIRKRDGIDQVLFLAPEERGVLKPFYSIGSLFLRRAEHVQECLHQKSTRAAAGVVYGFAGLRINGFDHGADDLTRGKKLTPVVALLTWSAPSLCTNQ